MSRVVRVTLAAIATLVVLGLAPLPAQPVRVDVQTVGPDMPEGG